MLLNKIFKSFNFSQHRLRLRSRLQSWKPFFSVIDRIFLKRPKKLSQFGHNVFFNHENIRKQKIWRLLATVNLG